MRYAIPIALSLAASIFVLPSPAEDPRPEVEGTPVEITASDLASALGVQWWSYQLRFKEPVSGISARPCELRRRPDGTWQRAYLAPGTGDFTGGKSREKRVAFFIPDTPGEPRFTIKLHNVTGRETFLQAPDFKQTYTSLGPPRFIENCLILAYQEKDPHVMTGLEKNFVRLIALEIETDH